MESLKNAIFCINAFCGILFNFIAIYVTIKKSKDKSGEGYLKLMLLLFLSGIISSIIHGILRIQILIINDTMVFVLEIFNSFLENKIFLVFSIFFTYFTLTLPTSILISRYLFICKNIELNIFKTAIIIFIFSLLVLLVSHGVWTITNELPNDIISSWIIKEKINGKILTLNTFGIGNKIILKEWYLLFIEVLLYFLINYTTVIVLFLKYKKYINELENIMSEKTKKMNREFMLILLLQSFAPLFVTGFPDIIFVIMIIFKYLYGAEELGTIVLQLLNFTPIVNALLFLLLPSTNRKYIKKVFKKIYYITKGVNAPIAVTSIKN
ncbi:7TM GPCR, serpentine receptor class r (Str) family-containing protein [Strongyloides ratti]|uniref:7TM GPCR, serpentine receptor class r (Str) family-containing protein n=1 Tax=Strongyloides ratti TaxID=34506 RepID=A0A090MZU7_STRRB|nr:7TM GPCR, serpentine receptor class r (Str) family-containing protein [Strongyloides ratti]CEF69554.1 7TM GPCR, serpentine receptor class r (Str) family-containing protein [Strongyloides ratti]